ncbi:MAG: hypothetical protein J6H18_03555 [Lachnospiraceae bacterium]|nr:hypothetical protein [Lachnospiraceae bacterium]
MNNKDFFEYSKINPETMFDSYYVFSDVVIPQTGEEHNILTENNERLIDLTTTFQVLRSLGKQKGDADIQRIIAETINILDHCDKINYSAFCQFFMVYNQSFGIYRKLRRSEKTEFIFYMMERFCEERHI